MKLFAILLITVSTNISAMELPPPPSKPEKLPDMTIQIEYVEENSQPDEEIEEADITQEVAFTSELRQ